MGVNRGRHLSTQGGPAGRGGLSPAPIELVFRGRADELARMRHALRGLIGGIPARQVVTGEQGIGKSRLIAEALSHENVEGLVIHAGRALELDSERPFGPLIDALDLRRGSDQPARAAIGQLIATAMRRTGDAEQRREVQERIGALVRRLTDSVPVALVLEDMQWTDGHTVMALAHLLAECEDRPLGVFVTRRLLPADSAVDHLFESGRPPFELIDLDDLDSEVVALLAHDFLGAAPGPRLQRQIDQTGGNPMLLLAFLHAAKKAGSLCPQGDVIETETSMPPPEMRPLVLGRIARLSQRCQDLLTVAAVIERPFGVATVAAIARASVVDVLADLREALAARVLLEVAGVLSFRHELVRLVLYEATPMSVRAELHRQISEALQSDGGSPVIVGHHQLRAAELALSAEDDECWPADARERTVLRWELLTRTERSVALLVARGMSNKEVAARLQVSSRTVETHLAHVFAKLAINSRVQLAASVARAQASSADNGANGRSTDEAELLGTPEPRRERRLSSA